MMGIFFGIFTSLVMISMSVQSTSSDINQKSLEKRVATLEKIVQHLIGDQNLLNSNVSEDSVIKTLRKGALLREPQVAFSAYSTSDRSGISSNVILRFDGVISNIGSHYYPQDGIFIAPVTGVYLFHWHFIVYGSGSGNGYTKLMVNGTECGWSREQADNGKFQSSANLVIVEVKEKQHVWIQTQTNNIYSESKSSFSGYLLF